MNKTAPRFTNAFILWAKSWISRSPLGLWKTLFLYWNECLISGNGTPLNGISVSMSSEFISRVPWDFPVEDSLFSLGTITSCVMIPSARSVARNSPREMTPSSLLVKKNLHGQLPGSSNIWQVNITEYNVGFMVWEGSQRYGRVLFHRIRAHFQSLEFYSKFAGIICLFSHKDLEGCGADNGNGASSESLWWGK